MATTTADDVDLELRLPKKARRKSNRIYFIFYFFLWMFIGSLWILPPLLFNKISQQCHLSLLSTSLLFCTYYILNGISSLLSRFIMNRDYFVKTHLFTSILLILCIICFQFMSLTDRYMHQLIIWSMISIVDGYLNNAAPVYLYRIYHIEASIMLTLCTIIANFTTIIIAMSCINSGSSYGGTLNFISFLGLLSCLGLIPLKSPSQKELIDAIKQCRNEIIEKKLESIQNKAENENKWHSMRNSVLFATRKQSTNNRISISGTLSSYFHQHAPEISFNPSVINTINTANKDSHIHYPINAKLGSITIKTNTRKMYTPTQTKTSFKSEKHHSIAPTPIIIENDEEEEEKTKTFNTFASSNVRKIIAYSTNPPILAHSVNDSRCHTLEMIWRETENDKTCTQPIITTPTERQSVDKHIAPELQQQQRGDISSGTNTPNTQLSKLKTMSTKRRVLFADSILIERNEEEEDDDANRLTFHSFNSPVSNTLGGNKTPDNVYWFDIEKRFDSFSVVSKRADTALASYIMNDIDHNKYAAEHEDQRKYSETFSGTKSYDVTLNRISTINKTITMKPIDEEEEKEKENHQKYNEIILTYLKKSKQTLFIFIVWITMIFAAQKVCYLTFITIYVMQFVGAQEFIAVWLITVYLFGHFLSRCAMIFILKRYNAKNLLLVFQFLMFVNCLILLMVDWIHFDSPANNKESRRFTKLMLFIILFMAGFTSSPINVICFSFLNGIQKVTHFLSTIIHFTAAISNAFSILAIAAIIDAFGIETFPYYIMLILFVAIIIAIAVNIKYMLFAQRLYALQY